MEPDSFKPTQKTVLVKKIKVLVKRPIAPSVPAPANPNGRAPAKRILIKVPIKRPAIPTAPIVPQAPIMPTAPVVSRTPMPTAPAASQTPIPPRHAPPKVAPPRGLHDERIKPLIYEIPRNILSRIEARKKIPEKLFLLYIFARTLAEENARQDGFAFPKMLIDLPKDTMEAARLLNQIDETIYDSLLSDFAEISPFIPGLERVMHNPAPVEELIANEIKRVEQQSDLSSNQQVVLALLMILADMKTVQHKLALHKVKAHENVLIGEIRAIENSEKELKRRFVSAIQRRGFPVNATKLVNNYFNMAKKDPAKAYKTLTTNPMYFSPIQTERLPKKFFGLFPPNPEDAVAINKKLAAFLKRLKV